MAEQTDMCNECGRPFTDSVELFRDQHKSGVEYCMPISNFGGHLTCAERTIERLKNKICSAEQVISAAESALSLIVGSAQGDQLDEALKKYRDPGKARQSKR